MKFEVPEKYKISDNVEKARAQCSTDVDSRLKLALIQFVGYCNEELYNEVVKALEVLDSVKLPEMGGYNMYYIVETRKEELLRRITAYNLASLDVMLGCTMVKNDVEERLRKEGYK